MPVSRVTFGPTRFLIRQFSSKEKSVFKELSNYLQEHLVLSQEFSELGHTLQHERELDIILSSRKHQRNCRVYGLKLLN